MKKAFINLVFFFFLSLLLASCSKEKDYKVDNGDDAAYSPAKDQGIQSYNLEQNKDQVSSRNPYDTLALREYILNNYPAGSYLVQFDKAYTYNVPKYALIYHKADGNYIFAVVAKSKAGERLIETKNIIGYNSSFVNLDSTKLGTAFFYLTLFDCVDNGFQVVWEKEIPIHGGFNKMTYNIWRTKGIPYICCDYEDGIIVGHRDYNLFLVDGLRSVPHLLETYEGLSRRRTVTNLNNDKIPDYYEYFFYNLSNKVYPVDSVGFIWDIKRNLYVNTRNPKQTREF